MDFRNFHIGKMIEERVAEREIEISRICNFLKVEKQEVLKMYESDDIEVKILLRWSKLLEYDFFRIYSQHLILYAPSLVHSKNKAGKTSLPEFRKSIYTREVIDFLLELIDTGKKTRAEVIEEYGIPKTTLYKWISKNSTLEQKKRA